MLVNIHFKETGCVVYYGADVSKILNLNIILIFAICTSIVVGVLTINPEYHNWGGDFACYVKQAKCLSEGNIQKCVEYNTYRDEMSLLGPVMCAWGYPVILSLSIDLFGMDWWFLKLVTYVFFVTLLLVVFFLFKDRLSLENRLWVVLLLSTSPFFYFFKQNVLTDVPVAFFQLLSLLLIQRLFVDGKSRFKEMTMVLLGLVMFFGFFVHPRAVVLLPLLFFTQLFFYGKRIVRPSVFVSALIPYVVFFALQITVNSILPVSSYSNHMVDSSEMSMYLSSFFSNLIYYPLQFYYFFNATWSFFSVIDLLFVIMALFTLIGLQKKEYTSYHYRLFVLAVLGIAVLFPYAPVPRYLIAAFPIILFFLIEGVGAISNSAVKPNRNKYYVRIISFLLVAFFVFQNFIYYLNTKDGPFSQDATHLFSYVNENIPDRTPVYFIKPRVLNLFTDVWSFSLDSLAIQEGVNYYVFVKSYEDFQQVWMLEQAGGTVVFENESMIIYYVE